MESSSSVSPWYVVQKHWRATQERVEKFLSDTYFTDANLRGRLYPARADLQSLKIYSPKIKIDYHEVVEALLTGQEVLGKDVNFGPSWTTHWFKCDMIVPVEWAGKHVRFRWDSNCEAMIWKDGHTVQGLTGSSDTSQLRTDFILTRSAHGGERYILYIEAAANGMFGVGHKGMINPPDETRQFHLNMAEIAVFDQEVYDLIMDLTLIIDMAKHLPRESTRAHQALCTANEIVNQCDPFNKDTLLRCRETAAQFLSERNGDSQHMIHAMGHCHIDSAWLWPYSETRKKCARSWSSTLQLMDEYPNFTFVCSQAQQLQWVKEDYPSLYRRIKEKAAGGQFIPVGGTWIEMDGNIPSGESLVRQFLLGQRFFKKEFGNYCKEFWLPDTFGYSAQLPQIMQGAGISFFLSQKLSWNFTNQFPHNSFLWEGIDGSSVLAHFPPADTYESRGDVSDILKTVRQFKEKGRSRRSVLLYGHGDGGGGPTEDMLESLKRMEDVDGLPRVKFSTPSSFFSDLQTDDSAKLCKWVGELYLELHRGTYTTHAKIKKENRTGEFLLHDLDFVTALSFSIKYDKERVDMVRARIFSLWQKFLLNQFHDVLPGSCIEQVAKDALAYYKDVKSQCSSILIKELIELLSKIWSCSDTNDAHTVIVNSFSWKRREVVVIPHASLTVDDGCSDGETDQDCKPNQPKRVKTEGTTERLLQTEGTTERLLQTVHNGTRIGLTSCEAMTVQEIVLYSPDEEVEVRYDETDGSFVLENKLLRAVITGCGLLRSLVHKTSGREAIDPGCAGNQFVLFDDIPLFWDAWDVMEYHLETRKPIKCNRKGKTCILDTGPLRVSLQIELEISEKSHITQEIILDADSPYLRFNTQVEWHESHKFLKVEFPFNVHSPEAKYEIQFGHLSRPTHFNTSWEQAKFEVCAQKWADISEHGFGVALINDCKYGYSTLDNIMRLSLLRSPKAPDEHADMGQHSFAYAVMPHQGSFQSAGVIQESYNFNHPLPLIEQLFSGEKQSFFRVDCNVESAVVLETVKPCEDDQGRALVVRMYESFGAHVKAKLTSLLPLTKYQRCNLLEEPVERAVECGADNSVITVDMKPFEIVTFTLYLA